MTVFDSAGQFTAPMEQVADLVRRRVDPLTTGPPGWRRGDVVYPTAA